MLKKILFPTDNSDQAQSALNYVLEVAQKFKSEVVIFYSYDLPDNLTNKVFGNNQANEEIENEILFSYQNFLDGIKNEMETKGIKAKVLIGKGKAGLSITEAILSENCDMVIMGRRSLNSLKGFLLGSVSNYVCHHTKCPILFIDNANKEVKYEDAGD